MVALGPGSPRTERIGTNQPVLLPPERHWGPIHREIDIDHFWALFDAGSMPAVFAGKITKDLFDLQCHLPAVTLIREHTNVSEPYQSGENLVRVGNGRRRLQFCFSQFNLAAPSFTARPIDRTGTPLKSDEPPFCHRKGSTTVRVGAPGRIRTCDQLLRRQLLCPAELQGPRLTSQYPNSCILYGLLTDRNYASVIYLP